MSNRKKTKLMPLGLQVYLALCAFITSRRLCRRSVTNDRLKGEFGIPVITGVQRLFTSDLNAIPADDQKENPKYLKSIEAFSQLKDHIKIVQGRMFTNEKKNEAYEVIVTEKAFQVLDLLMDKTYIISNSNVNTKV